jgi:hypothetical protein
MAGNPPADPAQPFGMNGIILTVIMNETHEPRAPRIPNFLFQNPKNKRAPNNHFPPIVLVLVLVLDLDRDWFKQLRSGDER